MIFIINFEKYNTDKMELVCKSFGFKLWRSRKGNWLLTKNKLFGNRAFALYRSEAAAFLLKHDLKKYEELFGEIEEA